MKSLLKPFVAICFLVIIGAQVAQAQNSQFKPTFPASANEAKPEATPASTKSLAAPDTTRDRAAFNAVTAPSSNVTSNGLQFGDETGWEIFLAGGGSFWSSQDASLRIDDVLQITPNSDYSPFGSQRYRVRQSFAPGGRVAMGLVKNINHQSAIEFSYLYGTNNFRLTAAEDISFFGYGYYPYGYDSVNGSSSSCGGYVYGCVPAGDTRSLAMRSHIASVNYRHSFVNNERARVYATGGFHLTFFQPTNDGLDRLFHLGPDSDGVFKVKPHFRNVTAPGVNFGGGVIVKASDTVGFRFDVRDYMTFTRRVSGRAELNSGEKIELNLFGDTIHNLVPTVGVVFTPR